MHKIAETLYSRDISNTYIYVWFDWTLKFEDFKSNHDKSTLSPDGLLVDRKSSGNSDEFGTFTYGALVDHQIRSDVWSTSKICGEPRLQTLVFNLFTFVYTHIFCHGRTHLCWKGHPTSSKVFHSAIVSRDQDSTRTSSKGACHRETFGDTGSTLIIIGSICVWLSYITLLGLQEPQQDEYFIYL